MATKLTAAEIEAAKRKLDIDTVLNGKVELNADLLYTIPINEKKTEELLNKIDTEFGKVPNANNVEDLIKNSTTGIEATLKKTNSKQFFSGEEAQKNIKNMKEIGDLIPILAFSFESIDQEQKNLIENITDIVKKYNEKLKYFKSEARRELLEKAAAEFNAKNLEYDGFPKTKKYKFIKDAVKDDDECPNKTKANSPVYDSEFEYCKEDKSIRYSTFKPGTEENDVEIEERDEDNDGIKEVRINNWKVHKYKQIKLDYYGSNYVTRDATRFVEAEGLFEAVGCDLPYDKDALEKIEKEENIEKDLDWHWNQGGSSFNNAKNKWYVPPEEEEV